ncbi:MAG TPA: CHASE domain-containing protein [Pyrinomonadaceae bacterium]|jgi:PAS domain S-box-containing protein
MSARFPKQIKARRVWVPYFIMATALILTLVATYYVMKTAEAKDRLQFQTTVQRTHDNIQKRLETYIELLYAGSALFAVNETVSREQFHTFIQRLEVGQRFPGLQGIGYTVRVRAEDRDAFAAGMRRQGFEDFKFWPETPRSEYHSIIYLEPLDQRNRAVVGYDMFTEPTRRVAMERARDTGVAAASGRVTLVQEIVAEHKQAGFLIYVPVYRGGQIPAGVAERQQALLGFVYSPFRVDDLLQGIFGNETYRSIDFEIYDGAEPSARNLLHRSAQSINKETHSPQYTASTKLDVAGRTWHINFSSRPEFDEVSGTRLVPLIPMGGLLISVLLFGVSWSQAHARRAAERSAFDLRHSEEALRESESRLRRLVEANVIGLIIADFKGHIIEANDAFLNIIGYTREDLARGQLNRAEITPPEYRHLYEEAMEEMKRTGSHAPYEKEYIRKDGTRVPVLVGTAYLGGSDDLTVGFILDLTERKRAEQALHEADRRALVEYERLLERIASLAQALGTARDLVTVFRALRDFAVASAPCIGIFISLYDPVRDVRTAAYAWGDGQEIDITQLPPMPITNEGPNSRAVRTGEIVVTNDFQPLRPNHPGIKVGVDNGMLPRSSLVAPMSVMGRIIGTIDVQSYDPDAYGEEHVTALRMAANLAAVAVENVRLFERENKARTLAEESNRMKDEFLATVSHELRTPLTAIFGWSRLLSSGTLDAEASTRAVETIERNARAQAQIIDDILDVSRIITGKLHFDVEAFELTNVVEAAINAVRPAADAKHIRLETVFENHPFLISGDQNRLQQVVWNLLSNAVKFTPAGGRVEVGLTQSGSHVEITVTDTGQGISPEFLPYVFDRFRQADASTTRQHGGLGLGLAIVRHLVELHGGTVSAESPGEGLGASFRVRLPLLGVRPEITTTASSTERAQATINQTANTPQQLAGLRVLVVEDEPDTRSMLKMVLESCAAHVRAVASAHDALKTLEDWQPDVLLSDIGMPEMDGYELIKRVKEMEAARGRQLPAVALTAYAREEDRERLISAGYQMYLAKPVEPSELVRAIAQLAGQTTGSL